MFPQPETIGAFSELDPAAVRDTITSVFAAPGYQQSLRESLGDRILAWIILRVAELVHALRGAADIRWVIIGAAIIILLVVAARATFLARTSFARTAPRRSTRAANALDSWNEAQAKAAAGSYADAAHLLYAAILHALALREGIVLHPSRTIGEYQHDLRSRSARALRDFRAFTRKYEVAVWRIGALAEQDYSELARLAQPIVFGDDQRAAA